MPRSQRLTFLAIAAVIALVAGVLLLGGGDDEPETAANTPAAAPTATATAEAAPEATETATPEPTPTPRPQPPLIEPGKVRELRFTEGEEIVFRARSDAPDEIHVHGYDITEPTTAEPTRVTFPATITGIFEIELHGTGEQIAELRVDPE